MYTVVNQTVNNFKIFYTYFCNKLLLFCAIQFLVPCTSVPQSEHFGHENFMNNLQDVKPAVNDLKS